VADVVTFMEHALVALGLLLAWCAFVYVKPDKACRKCSGWGQRQRRSGPAACGRCKATGRTMRLSARIVHGVVVIVRDQLRAYLERRREAS
jgi:hypothetical protein